MFLLRGLLISLSAFIIVYAATAVAIACAWRVYTALAGARPASSPRANLLYCVRMTPLALAVITVAGLTVPSFLRFEPRGSEEALGLLPVLFTMAFLLLMGVSTARAWSALRRTNRSVRMWTREDRPAIACDRVRAQTAVIVTSPDAPPVALAGVGKPTLVISAAASASLTGAELERTIAHEMAHRQARDNFKKLLVHAFAFPGMAELESVWLEAVEIAADSRAVRCETDALHLASALVKIARLRGGAVPTLASGLVDGARSALEFRIQRLLHWTPQPVRRARVLWPAALVAGLTVLGCNYFTVLKSVHVFAELLVR